MNKVHNSSDGNAQRDSRRDRMRSAYRIEINGFRVARDAADARVAWYHLERAHIVAQSFLRLHLSSHFEMMKFAFAQRDHREMIGQLLRIALVPLGALTRRLPKGNTGRAGVSAFRPMPVPSDLRRLVDDPAS